MWINGRELTGRELEEEFWAEFDTKVNRGELGVNQAVSVVESTLKGLFESPEAGHTALQAALKG